MAFLLLFQVKHVKLIGFFSLLIGWLFGWQNFNSNKVKTKEKSTFWQFPNIIFGSILLSFIRSLYIKIEGYFIKMSKENTITPKWMNW